MDPSGSHLLTYLLDEDFTVDFKKLCNIVIILLDEEIEHSSLTQSDLQYRLPDRGIIEVVYYKYIIGKVMGTPYTPLNSRVKVWKSPVFASLIDLNEVDRRAIRNDGEKIMQRLAARLKEELPPADKKPGTQPALPPAQLISNDPRPGSSKPKHQPKLPTKPLTEAEIKSMIAASVEKVDDFLWDRTAVRMFMEGHTYDDIGDVVGVVGPVVGNRLSQLRKEHGDHIVWTHSIRRKIYFLKIRDVE